MKHFIIHIFNYGETQINGNEFSVKVNTNSLTTTQPIIDAVWALKPQNSQAEQSFRAVNIFGFNDIRYMTKNGYNVKTTPEIKTLIEALVVELKTAFDALPTQNQNGVVTPPAPNTDAPVN